MSASFGMKDFRRPPQKRKPIHTTEKVIKNSFPLDLARSIGLNVEGNDKAFVYC